MYTQQDAIDAINNGDNTVISGFGGTGKSWIIGQVTDNKTILAAPTGIAALNIKGETCHSIFGLPFGIPTQQELDKIPPHMFSLFKGEHVSKVIIDECFQGDVEVLTNKGFIRFDELTKIEKIAQLDTTNQEVSFSKPLRYICKDYDGNMVNLKTKNKINLTCTYNHELLTYNKEDNKFSKIIAGDFKSNSKDLILSAGSLKDEGGCLSVMDKLAIAFQADGYCRGAYNATLKNINMTKKRFGFSPKKDHCTVIFNLKKSSKIDRFLEDFSSLGIEERKNPKKDYKTFSIRNVPVKYVNKDFSKIFTLEDFCLSKAREFLRYIKHWDGLKGTTKSSGGYCNTNKSSIDFVQSLCCLSGCKSNLSKIVDNRKKSYKDHYKLYFDLDNNYITTQNIEKNIFNYKGRVYCVEMPKGSIIVRSGRSTHVVGNCSMLRADHLDAIDYKLRKIRGINKPFGGLQVILVGDFWQLPCIVSAEEKRFYRRLYKSGFIFDSNVWQEADLKHIVLEKAYRQDDTTQVDLLNAIRTKEAGWQDAVKEINKLCKFTPTEHTLTLCMLNKDADKINKIYYDKNNNPVKTYLAKTTGKFNKRDCIVEPELKLKVGLRAIVCANCPDKTYKNGQMGEVVELLDDCVILRLDDGDVVTVATHRWESTKYKNGVKGLTKTVAGTCTQIPIRQGNAISINKSQSLTLDELSINLGKAKPREATVYVALSRIRDLTNIHLVRDIKEDDIVINRDVQRYYNNLKYGVKLSNYQNAN